MSKTIQVSDVVRYTKDSRRYVVYTGLPRDGCTIVLLDEFIQFNPKDYPENKIPEWAKVYDVKEEDLELFAKSEDYNWS